MNITKLVLGACITNCYIVVSEQKNCIIIDPADEAEKIIAVKYIVITHGHTDHVLALEAVKKHFGADIVISRIDAWRLEDEELINERPYVRVPYRAVKPDVLIEEGDVLEVDELKFKFYGMPGHTDGSMAIVIDDIIFTGDTLLKENHGKTTLPGGDEDKLIESINRLEKAFPGDYRILTGHREETTLDYERKYNPYITR